jgi:hypothetical protein
VQPQPRVRGQACRPPPAAQQLVAPTARHQQLLSAQHSGCNDSAIVRKEVDGQFAAHLVAALSLTMPHLSLSPLDPAASAIIDQSANTSNHFLFECIQRVRERRILMLGVARRDVSLPAGDVQMDRSRHRI